MKSAIILAGGQSSRVGSDKGLLAVDGKTLVERVCEVAATVAHEVIVAVGSNEQQESYSRILREYIITVDRHHAGPVAGLWSALTDAKGEAALVLGCDMPLLCKEVLSFLFRRCSSHDAAIPRWPNGYLEPLHAVYKTDRCLAATKKTLDPGGRDFRSMIMNLRDIEYVPIDDIQKLDRSLLTFFNINTPSDLQKLKSILRSRSI